ncbi:MAG: hypothetical protein EXS64_21070, partial [Candidatus Latescibacteria bacterium]|nr:hypothetical protein [Candidatus Latescibacterota bacterium]
MKGSPETQAEETPPGTTPRAVLIGILLSVLLAFLSVCEQAIGGQLSLTEDGFGTGALSFLFALICVVGLLKRAGVVRS